MELLFLGPHANRGLEGGEEDKMGPSQENYKWKYTEP